MKEKFKKLCSEFRRGDADGIPVEKAAAVLLEEDCLNPKTEAEMARYGVYERYPGGPVHWFAEIARRARRGEGPTQMGVPVTGLEYLATQWSGLGGPWKEALKKARKEFPIKVLPLP